MGNYRRWEGAAPGGDAARLPPPPSPFQPTCEHCTPRCCPTAAATSGAHRCRGGVPSAAPSASVGPAPNRITESLFTGLSFSRVRGGFSSRPRKSPSTTVIRAVPSLPPPPPPQAHPIPPASPTTALGSGGCRGASASRRGARGGGVRDAGVGHLPLQGNQGEGGSGDRRFISRAGGWAPQRCRPFSSHLGEVKISRKWLQIGLTPPSRTPPNKVYYRPASNPFKSPHGGQGWD